jgi:hypothetical protein
MDALRALQSIVVLCVPPLSEEHFRATERGLKRALERLGPRGAINVHLLLALLVSNPWKKSLEQRENRGE